MALRHLFSLLALVLTTSVALSGVALAADPYGPHTGSATVNKTVIVQGTWVRVSGDGFCPNRSVRVVVGVSGDRYIDKTVTSDADGVAEVHLRLTALGINNITLSGCYSGGGRQVLSAQVKVVPHRGKAYVDDDRVSTGDKVRAWGGGYCKRTAIEVRVLDDGKLYKTKTIDADRDGRAETGLRLKRAGRTVIAIEGCRAKGGTLIRTVVVKVRASRSLSASPAALAGRASDVPPAGYLVLGSGLVFLLGAGHLVRGRRRSSRG